MDEDKAAVDEDVEEVDEDVEEVDGDEAAVDGDGAAKEARAHAGGTWTPMRLADGRPLASWLVAADSRLDLLIRFHR